MQPKGREPGIYLNLSMEDYHNDPAIGGVALKNILISDEKFWAESNMNPEREELDTKDFKIGRAYHLMVLEPEKPFPFTIKDGKDGKHLQSTTEEGKIGRGDYNDLLAMYHRLLKQPAHWNALHGENAFVEVSIFWRDEETGLMCKCRPDSFSPEWVGDLKTAKDISDEGLFYDFTKYGYHVSGYRYSKGMVELKKMIRAGYKMPMEFSQDFVNKFMAEEKQRFFFVFQEKKKPCSTRLRAMTPYVSELGYTYFYKGIHKIREYYSKPGFDPATAPLAYPDIEPINDGDIYERKEF